MQAHVPCLILLACRLCSQVGAVRDELPAAAQQRASMVCATVQPGGASHTHGAAQRSAQVCVTTPPAYCALCGCTGIVGGTSHTHGTAQRSAQVRGGAHSYCALPENSSYLLVH
jgi:hypothetical protein